MSNLFTVRINMALALLLMLVTCIGIDAQAQSGGLLLRETTSGLEIAVVDETGVVTSVLQSLPNYGFESSSGATWVLHPDPQIPTRRDLALSPDGTQLAFVAVQNQTQFQLLVYQQATNTLIEESLSAYAYPTWSPDGQELLLEMVYVPNGSTLPESTIYLPSSNTFRQLTNDVVALERSFQWLPDGNSIIYQKNRDIFLTDAFGTNHQQLTQLEQQLLPDVTAFVCDRVWSPVAERIYFSVGCPDGVEYLYSVDLNGNVRFELSVTALYPEDYDPTFVPVSISGIFPQPSTTDVLVVVEIRTLNTSNGSQDKQIAIYRLTAPENTELIFERVYTFDTAISISVSDISPDQSYIALAGGNSGRDNSYQVIVVDLSDGSTSFEQSGLQGVCNLNWLDEHTVAYGIIPRLNCIYDRFAISTESVDVLTGNVTSISSSPSVIGTPIEYLYPSVSAPDQILFSSVTDPFTAASNIFVINPDGTGQTQLTTGSSTKNFPAWSPDGTQILYTSNQDGDDEIFVMNADGSNPLQLTSNTALDRFPVWSQDGSQIAFASYRDGNWEIYTMNADGTNPINLTNHASDDFNVSWSPDGTQIAFASYRNATTTFDTDIYVMNADGTNVQRLTNSPSIDETPNWSPDGSQIAFTSDRSAGNIDIYTMNADGTNVQRITTYSGTDEFPNWSPDGTQIAFDSNRSSLFNLYFDIHTMNADGTNVQRITTNGAFDRFAAWGYP